MSAKQCSVVVGPWPRMQARLLLALAESDDSPLSSDYEQARLWAIVVGVDSEVLTALSSSLLEPPSPSTPVVRVRLGSWDAMRFRVLSEVVALEGGQHGAADLLGMTRIELGVLLRQLGRFDLGQD